MTVSTGPAEPVPVAMLARTSTLLLQDPTARLRRQITSTREWLPHGFYVAGYYWDVESGGWTWRRAGTEHYEPFMAKGLPRDGGLADLLSEARPRAPVRRRGGRGHRARRPRFLQFGEAGTRTRPTRASRCSPPTSRPISPASTRPPFLCGG